MHVLFLQIQIGSSHMSQISVILLLYCFLLPLLFLLVCLSLFVFHCYIRQVSVAERVRAFALIDLCRWFLPVWSVVQNPHGLDFNV